MGTSHPLTALTLFFENYKLSSQPFLLALSGGADSLSLFYCLLSYQKKYPLSFHIAHVDHGWREESVDEAEQLRQLAAKHHIVFHTVRLDLKNKKGNLENLSREERYKFFYELHKIYNYQGILTGHQANDQAETVLKRVLEGAHWTHFSGLSPSRELFGIPLLRPFLSVSKKDLENYLNELGVIPFDDSSNKNPRFLRARMRETILPRLNQEFGKEIQNPLINLSHDAKELKDYFDAKITPFLASVKRGPFGILLNLHDHQELKKVEIKHLIHTLAESEGIFLSREMIDTASSMLQSGQANCQFHQGFFIDRKRIFILRPFSPFDQTIDLKKGSFQVGKWSIQIEDSSNAISEKRQNWEAGWSGNFEVVLPHGTYQMALPIAKATYYNRSISISKFWNNHQIPAFLRMHLPVIWKDQTIYHELLTGKSHIDQNHNRSLTVSISLSY